MPKMRAHERVQPGVREAPVVPVGQVVLQILMEWEALFFEGVEVPQGLMEVLMEGQRALVGLEALEAQMEPVVPVELAVQLQVVWVPHHWVLEELEGPLEVHQHWVV